MALKLVDQYNEFQRNKKIYSSNVEKFYGIDGLDAYNPSIPFEFNGKTYIAARVEERKSEKA